MTQHLTLKATTTATDTESGTFSAIVSSWDADRVGDTIDRHAFDQSIADWRASGKHLPLLFEHITTAVGSLDPYTMTTDEQGLHVDGEVDRDTSEGKQVWAQIKRGSIGFSIGFKIDKSRPSKGGGDHLLVVDLLEVSATSTPMHAATKVTDWKSMGYEELRKASLDAIKGVETRPVRIASFRC